MVATYRVKPGNYREAARDSGCSYIVAKRAWLRGWPIPRWASIPISTILENDIKRTRAELAREEIRLLELREREAERQAAQQKIELSFDIDAERKREIQAIRLTTSASLTLLANVGTFSRVSHELANAMAGKLSERVREGSIDIAEGMMILRKIANLTSISTSQLRDSMEISRLHIGVDPKSVLSGGFVQPSVKSVSFVDGDAVVRELGEDCAKKAVIDLAEGRMSPEVDRLIKWQAGRVLEGGIN